MMKHSGSLRERVALAAALLTITCATAQVVQSVDYIGQETFPTNYSYGGTNMGGLSGLTYDAGSGSYRAISDDRSQINPARFYSLDIDLSGDLLQPGRVSFTGVTTLLDGGGQPYGNGSLDPEGIAFAPNGDLFISSEGQNSATVINPFVNRYSPSGALQNELAVPTKYLPVFNPAYGVRNNLAFETLTISPSAGSLFTATENALFQDGPAAALGQTTNSRILRYALNGLAGTPAEEFVYVADAVADEPIPPGSFATNGLVDMLAMDDTTFIAMERSFSTGVGNRIKLYEVSLDGATDVSGADMLPGSFTPVSKRLLLDLNDLGITLDNVEGLTFGPQLSDGRQSLILVSDNNFSTTQFTQFLAFGVTFVPEPGALTLLALAGAVFCQRRR